ncbi:hypothetical protein FKW77_000501 [Venturia effusa]|uniref:DNA primase large subunit n=1 Tax=Venturia effusa TaxID=50376 RepID=A0A517L8H2_9PEZI|nr:hypothetical protein FKW77_000501 [Venturia effusa]
MLRLEREQARLEAKRRHITNPQKQQFADSLWEEQNYPHRLNFYITPPTADISLEEFEEYAIARLKILTELETCTFRNRTPEETTAYMTPLLHKYLPLQSNSANVDHVAQEERRRDHFSHFILRLAFSKTEELRKRFSRLEAMLFRLRYQSDDARELKNFTSSVHFAWEPVTADEMESVGELARDASESFFVKEEEAEREEYFKVDWEQVPDLVEQRRVYLSEGLAYVPMKEQMTLVINDFSRRLDIALELTSRQLGRLDEDDRLAPILEHLSRSFAAPDATYDTDCAPNQLHPTSTNIETLSKHFPLCMAHLQSTLKETAHLKHYGRLQYTLFLKGMGMSLEDCIQYWRRSFRLITDEKFNKEYKYNVRHAYGDVGGDSNRRGRGYTPFSCQKLLTEALPSSGQNHGCPYRTFSADNLVPLLHNFGVREKDVLRGVKEDVAKQRYHVACNRVFEHMHATEIKKVKEEGLWTAAQLDTLLHPNEYFKRSFLLKHLEEPKEEAMQE